MNHYAFRLVLFVLGFWGTSAAADRAPEIDIGLTEQEKAWIAAHPVIRAGHDPSFEPYAIYGQKGEIVGVDPDFLEIVARRTGLKFQHMARESWNETLAAFKAREIDILGSVGSSEEREAYMAYSRVYTLAPNVIITRNDTPYLFDLHDLAGKRISVPRGYAGLRNDLNEHAPGHIIVEYETTLECLRAVAEGEVFASIGDSANSAYLVKAHRLSGLRLGSVISASSEIFFGVRKDWPELLSIVNKTIASITPLERKQINDRWIAADYMQDRRWVGAFKLAAGVALAALLVFAAVFWHNRRLARELNERRRMQVELEEAHRSLTGASEEKSALMHMLAHDLRNPLTAISMSVDLLRMGNLPRDLTEPVARLRGQVQKMSRLIDDLMDANAIEAGQRQYRFALVDLSRTVRATVESFTEAAAMKQLRLELVLPDDAVRAETDEGAWRQVVDNLVSNAVKFSPSGQAIEVALSVREGEVRLKVSDRGPGMSASEVEGLFRKFSRGQARPTGGEKSSGLGLWIAQRVTHSLGGRIWCESALGQGTVFFVALPLQRVGATVQ